MIYLFKVILHLRNFSTWLRQHKCVCMLAQSCLTLFDPMDCGLPGSSVHGILQQEYWSGLPFPSPGNLLNPGNVPTSPMLADRRSPS